ncbi:hypothetical protein [Bacillus luti]|uniref:hypothetical protein n=1 Tax=Bacillus luti TaxID=2026191 RepID=UPI003D04531F
MPIKLTFYSAPRTKLISVSRYLKMIGVKHMYWKKDRDFPPMKFQFGGKITTIIGSCIISLYPYISLFIFLRKFATESN